MSFLEFLFVIFVLLVFTCLGFSFGIIYSHHTYFDFIQSFCVVIPVSTPFNASSLVTP